jgi:hypothetical protein
VGIPPSETTSIINIDLNGRVKTDINTAVVTPRAASAGYIPPQIGNLTATGPGTGSMNLTVLDADSIRNDHTYRLEFIDSTAFHTNSYPWYRLVDKTTRDTVVSLTRLQATQVQSPVIRGFVASITNDPDVIIDQAKTGWTNGNSNYVTQVGFDSRFAPAYQPRRVNYPADFEIRFTAKNQGDTSFPGSSFSSGVPSNIIIKNLTENIDHVQFIFQDINENSVFDAGDALFIVAGDSAGQPATQFFSARKSWSLTLLQDTLIPTAQQRVPQPGDVFHISTKKPFRTGEYFEFTTKAPTLDPSKAQKDLSKVAVVPNPYVGAASWEPQTTSVGRGDRRVFFIHLPHECTIRIYTLSGHLVQTVTHSSTIDDGQEPWNLVSRDGMNIAYGVYVFHVEAPGLGTYVSKFAVLK